MASSSISKLRRGIRKKGKLGFDPLPLLTRFVFYFYEVLNRTLLRILPIFNKNKTL
jgi:hypothetical protein